MFPMRTSLPDYGDKFYNNGNAGGWSWCINGNPTCAGRNVLSNCVGYACGRFNQIIGEMRYPQLCCNAEYFIEKAKQIGLEISDVPTMGGIMVWSKGSIYSGDDGGGHVAIVEDIYSTYDIYTSESAWGGTAFFNARRTGSNYGLNSSYRYIGCVVNPAVGRVTTGRGGQPTSDIVKQYQQWLNSQYGFSLAVDGIYGYDTNLKGVMALQLEYNAQWGAGLNVDGIMGPATKAASPVLTIGCQGNITRNVQYMLEIKGFSVGSYGVDGYYGNGTASAVRSYQASKGLAADGLCGPDTFYSLY